MITVISLLNLWYLFGKMRLLNRIIQELIRLGQITG